MKKGELEKVDGYENIIEEIRICRKYGIDRRGEKKSANLNIGRIHPAEMKLRVNNIIEHNSTVRSIRLTATDGYLPPFIAGQYISVVIDTGSFVTSRPYSISSSPGQRGYYEITVKKIDDGIASGYFFNRIKTGDILTASGPEGHFYHNPVFHKKKMVMIAGGSGITPFMSMIRETADAGLDRDIVLFYGSRRFEDVIFHEELALISKQNSNIRYFPVIEEKRGVHECHEGLITGGIIGTLAGDMSDKTFYICGPGAMYDFILGELKKAGVPGRRIRREIYGFDRNVRNNPGWDKSIRPGAEFNITVKNIKSFKARADIPLLVSLENAGVPIRALCRAGECGKCRVKLLSGKVFQPEPGHLRESDRASGYIHTCGAYPVADVEILL